MNFPPQTSARRQAGLYYARKNTRARVRVSNLTPWSAGLVITSGMVTAGTYVQSFGQAYIATSSGTTGATAPSGNSASYDGGVHWQFVYSAAILVQPGAA
jgi:hypothetical protein